MTNEEKQLLFKDLCARLPYGVKIHAEVGGEVFGDEELQIVNKSAILGDYGPVPVVNPVEDDTSDGFELTNVKPYLRPMSSMTEEEENEYRAINCYEGLFPCNEDALDYVLSHHLDFRGLIPMGLALEAKEGMYK